MVLLTITTEATEACRGDPKSEELCRLDLDRASAATGPFLQLCPRLAEGGIRCPHLAAGDAPSGRDQFPFKMRNNRRGARGLRARRQVMIESPLVTNRGRRHHEARQRPIGRQSACGRQADDDPGSSGLKLFPWT
jgi:hypothetical protein